MTVGVFHRPEARRRTREWKRIECADAERKETSRRGQTGWDENAGRNETKGRKSGRSIVTLLVNAVSRVGWSSM